MVTAAVETALAVRRAAGLQLTPVATYWHRVARFATARGQPDVTTPTVIAWATTAASAAQRHPRLLAVRRFAHCLQAEDPRQEIPPDTRFCGRRQRPRPDIVTAADLQHIMDDAHRLGPPGSLRPQPYRPLCGRLAATGMRPSEARALPRHDRTPDGLIIRERKFKQRRLLPLHDTTWAARERDLDRRRQVAGWAPHLFVSHRGGPLSHRVVADTFHAVVTATGLPREPGRACPTCMDLRHTCAVRGRATCPARRDQVGRQMLALTT